MSQITRLFQIAPPGAGVLTLTGDAGPAAGPDGLGNINIVGAGGITTTSNPATNTVTITNNVIAAQFTADFGVAAPVAGNLNIVGTANEIITSAALDTVIIQFPNDVTIPNDLFVTNNINSFGSIFSGNNISAANTLFGDNADIAITTTTANLVVNNTTTINGPTLLTTLAPGVAQVDGANLLFTSAGLNGQILIGANVGVPIWSNIVSGDGSVAVTNGINSIDLSVNTTVATIFAADLGNAIPAAHIIQIVGGANINTLGFGNTVQVNLNQFVTVIGNIVSTAGGITSNQQLVVQNNGASITGNVILPSYPVGVAQVNAASTLYTSNSALDGQVLIGSGVPGVNPVWNNITAGPGIDIINGAGSIGINTKLVLFRAFTPSSIDYLAITGAAPFTLGADLALTIISNEGGAFYPGDGAGTAASFTAPYTGYYQLGWILDLGYDATVVGATSLGPVNIKMIVSTTATNYSFVGCIDAPVINSNIPIGQSIDVLANNILLTAGDVVNFIAVIGTVPPASSPLRKNFRIPVATVYGFMVRNI